MSRSLYLWLFLGLLVLAHDARADAAAEEEEEEEEEDDIEEDPLDSTRFASIVVETAQAPHTYFWTTTWN